MNNHSNKLKALSPSLFSFLGVIIGALIAGIVSWQTQNLALKGSLQEIRAQNAQSELRETIDNASEYLSEIVTYLSIVDGNAPQEVLNEQYNKINRHGFVLLLTSSENLAKYTILLNAHLATMTSQHPTFRETIDRYVEDPNELFGKWIAAARSEIQLYRIESSPLSEDVSEYVTLLRIFRGISIK